MKKVLFTLLVFVGFTAVIFLSSCEKIEQSSPITFDDLQIGTIQGRVWAELDNTSGGPEAVSGVKIIFKIDASEFDGNSQPGEKFIIYESTITNGSYTIDLPTTNKGIDVTVMACDFVYDVVINDEGATLKTTFNGVEIPGVNIVVGQTEVIDIDY